MSTTVQVDAAVHIDGHGGFYALLHYDPADPYAVGIEFPEVIDPRTFAPVRWPVARNLLDDGMRGPVGFGLAHDVQVWPEGKTVRLRLTGGSLCGGPTSATCSIPRHRLHYFLRRSFGLVPRGTERHEFDADDLIRRCNEWRAEL